MFFRSIGQHSRAPLGASLALVVLLSACAKSAGSPDVFVSDAPKELSSGITVYSKSVCENDSSCSPSVALLTIRSKGSLSQCMGSLVGNDLLVTTSHCLPEELRVSGGKCQGMIQAQFPAVGEFPEAQSDCQEVVAAASLYDRARAQPDYAFIRIASHVSRPALQFDHSGFENGAAFRIIQTESSIDFSGTPSGSSSGRIARMTSQVCHSVQSSAVLPGSTHPKSSVIAITDCTPNASSEGAPILDNQGRIHGMIQSLISSARISKKIEKSRLFTSKITPISWATNFACVRFPENDDDFYFPIPCEEDPNDLSMQAVEAQTQALISHSIQTTEKNYPWPTLSSDIQWQTKAFSSDSKEGQELSKAVHASSEFSVFAMPVPKCVVKGSNLNATSFSLPVIGYTSGLNRHLVLSIDRGKTLDGIPVRLEVSASWSPLGFINNLFTKAISIFVDRGNKPLILRYSLPECGA